MFRFITLGIILVLHIEANAGMFGYMKNKATENIKEGVKAKIVDTSKNIYSKNRENRLEYEKKTNKKSTLTKAEEALIATKKTAKETVIGSIGVENIEYLKKAKTQIENAYYK